MIKYGLLPAKLRDIREKLEQKERVIALVVYPSGQEIERIKSRKEFPPHGPFIIAQFLESLGFSVIVSPIHLREDIWKIYSANNQINSEINSKVDGQLNNGIQLLAISALTSPTFNQLRDAVNYFDQKIENLNKEGQKKSIPLKIIGGFHANLYPTSCIDALNGDILIHSDVEYNLFCLFKKPYQLIENLNGIAYRTVFNSKFKKKYKFQSQIKSQSDKINPNFHEVPERKISFDQIPFPAFRYLPENEFILTERVPYWDPITNKITFAKRTISILTARDCPYHCYYCASQPKKIQFKPINLVKEYLEKMINNYQIDSFVASDETFTLNKKWVYEFCAMVKPFNLKWSITTRADHISKEICDTLVSAGCTEIKIGLETANQEILDRMNKRIKVDRIEEAIQCASNSGLLVKILLIYGLPGENQKTTLNTIKFLEHNQKFIHRVTIFRFRPLPGSYLWEHFEEYGIDKPSLTSSIGIHDGGFKWIKDNKKRQELVKNCQKLDDFISLTFNPSLGSIKETSSLSSPSSPLSSSSPSSPSLLSSTSSILLNKPSLKKYKVINENV